MLFKDGVDLALAPKIARALPAIDRVYRAIAGHEPTITSGCDGQHMTTSLHYAGLAVDVRTRDVAPDKIEALRRALADALGDAYDVVVEKDHIHIEYDPN
jgi:hedgehog signaling domain-containing protein